MSNYRIKHTDGRLSITRQMVIRELAKRHDFTMNDVSIIFDGFGQLLREAMAQNKIVKISDLFSMRLVDIAGYEGWDAVRKKKMQVPPSRRVFISPTVTLARMGKVSLLPEEDKEGISYFDYDLDELIEFKKRIAKNEVDINKYE